MATLDDKLLGEKLHNYCSSSESEDEKDPENQDERQGGKQSGMKFIPDAEASIKEEDSWKGIATNTGPKGVIKDWQRFKQLETERGKNSDAEKHKLVKKLAMTCKSADLDEHLEKENLPKQKKESDQIDEDDLMEDEFFQEYIKKKFMEMNKKLNNLPKFGKVLELIGDTFLSEIDNENKNVKILIHIYDQKIPECRLMNECLEQISKDYLIVKFCKIRSAEINLSEKFKKIGCPALLIYQNGELIGNFVKMNDEFGDEFCAQDVENFLLEQGYLPSLEVRQIRDGVASNKLSDDDDDE